MGGLARICKMYGSLKATDNNGKTVEWYYDYVQDKPRIRSEMTHEEWCASEKKRWTQVHEKAPTQSDESKSLTPPSE